MVKKFLHLFSKENSIRGASILLIITLAFSNVLGLLRDRFLTKNISTYNLDVYYASFRIPDLIFNFLILGAITSAFVPVFLEYTARDEHKEGFRIANILINAFLLFTILAAVALWFLMPVLMPLVVPKFDPSRMAEAVKYSRLLMLTPVFFSLSYIFGGMLNSYKRFFAYSLSPIFYNVAIIVGAIGAKNYGLMSVVVAVIVGAFLHFVIQLYPAIKLGYHYQFVLDLKDQAVRKIFKLMVPRSLSLGVNQIMMIMYTAIASALAAGSISAFNLANNIQTMPVVALGTSFATAVFPTLAQKIAQKKQDQFAFYLNRALRAIGYLLIPSTVVMILLRAQIVRLILGSGKFNWDDTKLTALTLGFLSLSILAQGLIPMLAKAFYALKDTKTPMIVAFYTVVISIVAGFMLSKTMGVSGLALAFSIGSFFNAGALLFKLRKIYPGILDKNLELSYLKTTAISLIMGLFMWSSLHIMNRFVDMTRFWGVFTQSAVAVAVGAIVFVSLGYLLDQEEMKWAITRRINGKEQSAES